MRGRTRRENPLYPVSFWNVEKRVDENLPRTNNAVECFHSALHHFACSDCCDHRWKTILHAAMASVFVRLFYQNNPCEQIEAVLQQERRFTKVSIVN